MQFHARAGLASLVMLLAVLPRAVHGQSWEILNAARDVVSAATVREEDILDAARRAVQQKDLGERIASGTSPQARRLREATAAHSGEDGLSLNFLAYQSPSPMAFATADGSIRLSTGLMDMLDDDELRAVIGHHVGHVKLGHALGAMRTAYMAAAARKLASGAGRAQGYGAASQELGQVLEKALKSQFSQSQEHAADDYAAEFLRRHGYRPGVMESAGRKLARHGGLHAGSRAKAEGM